MSRNFVKWYLFFLKKAEHSRLLCACLFPLTICGFFFRVVTVVRRYALLFKAKKRRPCVPIVTVGNIAMGGTGKTPFILFFLKHFPDLRIGYVSRGYGRKEKSCYVASGNVDPLKAGDEATLIARTFPRVRISVFEDKWKAVEAIQHTVDLIILDDGLQRYDIPLSVSIAVVDAKCPDGALFPRGLLREPWSRLKAVDYIVVTNGSAKEIPKPLPSPWIETHSCITSFFSPDGVVHPVPNGQVALFSAIAKPERFSRSIQQLGVRVVDHLIFQDHEEITDDELFDYFGRVRSSHPDVTLVGTDKDWARRQTWPSLPLLFASFQLSVPKEDECFNQLLQKTRRLGTVQE
jgi:tetraacyldisaccharide 4'-kinase